MIVQVKRKIFREESTIGRLLIDREDMCFTLEDKVRGEDEDKVYGETAIPYGTYPIRLRTEGTTHWHYNQRFKGMHVGTLHIQDIPGYKYVLIHCGNTPEDTLGCILVGKKYNPGQPDRIDGSTDAYVKIYPRIANALKRGEDMSIEVTK